MISNGIKPTLCLPIRRELMNGDSAYLRLIQDQAHDGAFNMAADEFLLRDQIQRQDRNPVLRFYRFAKPTVTVGYNMWRLIASETENTIPIVRRLTGGGMVMHGSDLTYSLIAPAGDRKTLKKVRDSYFLIHEALRSALNYFDITTELFDKNCNTQAATFSGCKPKQVSHCFDSPVLFDVMFSGKKIAGAAQKRTQGYLLHQGSIAWNKLRETYPDLSLSTFPERFSICLAGSLDLSVKEIPFCVEEREEAFAFISDGYT